MSNGECQNICQGSYVFAVLQGNYCWCSNYVPDPSSQTNTLDCNQPCPGYGSEWCGSTSAGLYGYYNLGGTPLGTAGGQSSVSTNPKTSRTPSSLVTTTSSIPSGVTSTPAETTPEGASIASVVTVVHSQSSGETSSSTVDPSSVSLLVPSASTSSTYVRSHSSLREVVVIMCRYSTTSHSSSWSVLTVLVLP